jgi:hypothetical protein
MTKHLALKKFRNVKTKEQEFQFLKAISFTLWLLYVLGQQLLVPVY